MNSIEFKRIGRSIENVLGSSKRYNRTVYNIKKAKATGSLNFRFNKLIKLDFKTILDGFIEIMEEPTLKNKPYYRKVLAYKDNDFVRLFESYGYEISSWLVKDKELTKENNIAFFNFPLFFKESCRKCSIYRYATMDIKEIEELLKNYIDLKYTKSIVPRKDRDNIEDEILALGHTQSPSMNQYNTLSEEFSYSSLLSRTRPVQVIRVSKEVGSGFGFDLLQVDGERETLVATKASDNMESFLLSKVEYDTMVKASDLNNTRYYIDKYLFTEDGIVRLKTRYAYDRNNDVLVDIEDESNICNIERKDFTGKNGIPRVNFVCTPVKFKFEKSDREKGFELKKTLTNIKSNQ